MVVKLERRRYILVEFFEKSPNANSFNKKLREKVSQIAGELLLARSGLSVLEYKEKMLIIRCNHHSRDMVEAALCLLEFDDYFRINTISGTLKSIDQTLQEEDEET